MGGLLVLNGSSRRDGVTAQCLQVVARRIASEHGLDVDWVMIDDAIAGCRHCEVCVERCCQKDQLQEIIENMRVADRVLIGTPVYLDTPSSKVLAMLHRLTCMAEPTGRTFFAGKKAHLHANGYVSGTKAAIQVMMGACEMLGFTIEGRSTTEYIEKWNDWKIRGGLPGEGMYLPERTHRK